MRVFCPKFSHLAFRLHGANVQGVVNEDPGRSLPGMGGVELDAGFRGNTQRMEARRSQILVQDADRGGADHVDEAASLQ